MDNATILKNLKQVLEDKFGGLIERIVLFGSRATGQHTPRSDYDIGIDAGTPIPLHVMGYIQADIEELPILQKVDVVDLSQASEALRREVTAVAQTW